MAQRPPRHRICGWRDDDSLFEAIRAVVELSEVAVSNRGLGDDEDGFSAFLEATRRGYEMIGAKAMLAAPSFNKTIRWQWQRITVSRQLPAGQSFSAYKDAAEIRLAPHYFTRRLRLKQNPHQ